MAMSHDTIMSLSQDAVTSSPFQSPRAHGTPGRACMSPVPGFGLPAGRCASGEKKRKSGSWDAEEELMESLTCIVCMVRRICLPAWEGEAAARELTARPLPVATGDDARRDLPVPGRPPSLRGLQAPAPGQMPHLPNVHGQHSQPGPRTAGWPGRTATPRAPPPSARTAAWTTHAQHSRDGSGRCR